MQGCNAKKVIWSCSCSFFQAYSQTLKQFGWIFFREPMGTGTEVIQVKQIWFDVSSWTNGRTNLANFFTWIPTLFYKMDFIFNSTSIAAHFSLYIYITSSKQCSWPNLVLDYICKHSKLFVYQNYIYIILIVIFLNVFL